MKIFFIVLLLLVLLLFGAAAYLSAYGMRRGKNTDYDCDSPEVSDTGFAFFLQGYDDILSNHEKDEELTAAWRKKYGATEKCEIKSFDNLTLRGEIYRQSEKSALWMIGVHGHRANRLMMRLYARYYYERGFNVLLFDQRAHGKSEGTHIGMGWPERLDVIRWIESIVNEDSSAQIVLHGVSMGAATVMMTAGEELPKNVRAIISDCGYSSEWDILAFHLKRSFRLPSFPLLNIASLLEKLRFGNSFKEASAASAVSKSKTPILFIHGEADVYVPYFMLDVVFTASNCPKDILRVAGAPHASSAYTKPEMYWNKVFSFIDKYLD